MHYKVEWESDGFGWQEFEFNPINFAHACAFYAKYQGGRPIRIVRLDDDDNFIRVMEWHEIVAERPES